MSSLSCFSMTRARASLTDNNPSLPRPQQTENSPKTRTRTRTLPRTRRQRLKQQKTSQPSIIQIERAIGAGQFRDSEHIEEDLRKTIFDGLLPITTGKFEGQVEKKLRETGEWISSRTESTFRSSGKRILMIALQWVLPIWTFSLLVASGAIKLPWSTPFINDLIM